MGFYKQVHLDILEHKARGYSIEDTYIYYKDYIELEDLVAIWEGDFDEETV